MCRWVQMHECCECYRGRGGVDTEVSGRRYTHPAQQFQCYVTKLRSYFYLYYLMSPPKFSCGFVVAMLGPAGTKPDKEKRKRSVLMTRDVERAFERFEEAWFNFHRYDKDSSGTIDIKELGGLLSDLKLHVGRANRTEHQMHEWVQRELRKSDINGDVAASRRLGPAGPTGPSPSMP